MTTFLYFFWTGFSGVAPPQPFYRPAQTETADALFAQTESADSLYAQTESADALYTRIDEQVQ